MMKKEHKIYIKSHEAWRENMITGIVQDEMEYAYLNEKMNLLKKEITTLAESIRLNKKYLDSQSAVFASFKEQNGIK